MRPDIPEVDYNPDPGMAIEIVYLDDHLLIANKPPGLLSVPGRGAEKSVCLTAMLEPDYGTVLAVHRLDMDTSGLIVLARNTIAHRTLSRTFERRQIEKQYHAIVYGEPESRSGLIDLPIGRDWADRPRRCIDHVSGKPSQTSWLKLRTAPGRSLLQLSPHTGRTHQLRLHCSAIGHAIIGDRLYGSRGPKERLFLHASALLFDHPVTGAKIDIRSRPTFLDDEFLHK